MNVIVIHAWSDGDVNAIVRKRGAMLPPLSELDFGDSADNEDSPLLSPTNNNAFSTTSTTLVRTAAPATINNQ
ncbi:hypothetical protein Pelo_18051 [Pelomyxa schiedti]|nr:hypothetical protein Pelo_18051 [Pelomyxa schiedti]